MGIEIKVTPTRKLFFDENTYFGIYGCDVSTDTADKITLNQYNNISIKGTMPNLDMNEEYIAVVKEDKESKYKGSYILESIRKEKPITVAEQKNFLKSLLTPNQIENIYKVYGENEDIVGMIENGDFDYTKVHGLGDKTFEKLREKVLSNVDMSELLAFLSKYGIKYNMITKIVQQYKNPQIVIDKINSNPYILTEVKGIGFIKADTIAKAVGYDMNSPKRIESCLEYCIMEENDNGHSWLDAKLLINKAVDMLSVNRVLVENTIEELGDKFINDNGRYTLKYVYEAEKYIAQKLIQYKSYSKKVFQTEELDAMIDAYCAEHGVQLEKNQRQFMHDWNENSALLLVGGGGTGKTWCLNILLGFIKKKHMTTCLLAPTGRASKVMSNYTKLPASTIHRRIGIHEESDGRGEIHEDVVIVDETSMCDVLLMSKFFRSLRNPDSRILFVGDPTQLPSVSVGNFLYDLIHSGVVKVSYFVKAFRQKDGGILNVATDVREGTKFLNNDTEGRVVFGRDCVFWMTHQKFIRDGVITNYQKAMKRSRQEDIVVLTPTNKGDLGTAALNKELQKVANPPSPSKKERAVGKKDNQIVYRVGDIVMNTVNTYGIDTVNGGKADIFNGDTGKIIDIDDKEKVFIIEFDEIQVLIKFSNILSNITHAWAMSYHKSQGGQWDVVIVVADKSMTFQLNANLLYTGLSRAKKYLLVLCQAETINRAMGKFINMERRSFLQEFIKEFDV